MKIQRFFKTDFTMMVKMINALRVTHKTGLERSKYKRYNDEQNARFHLILRKNVNVFVIEVTRQPFMTTDSFKGKI